MSTPSLPGKTWINESRETSRATCAHHPGEIVRGRDWANGNSTAFGALCGCKTVDLFPPTSETAAEPAVPATQLRAAPKRAYALAYARRGIPVFPVHHIESDGECSCGKLGCSSAGKHPRNKGWQADAATDEGVIRDWWHTNPGANIGVACGEKSGLTVLDVDGDIGRETLRELELKHGELPITPVATTGSGGAHYYFRFEASVGNAVRFARGLDIRTEGGLVVGVGSKTKRRYIWMAGYELSDTLPPSAMPEWLVNSIRAGQHGNQNGGSFKLPDDFIVEGEGRNSWLYKLGRSLRAKRLPESAIRAAIEATNRDRCRPPMARAELDAIIANVIKQPDRAEFRNGDGSAETVQTKSVAFSEDALALEFAARYGDDLRHVPAYNKWYAWNGAAWVPDQILRVFDHSRVVCRSAAATAKRRMKAQLSAARTVAAVVKLARSDPRIVLPPDIFDADLWLLNAPGGAVDLRTGELRANRRKDYATKSTEVAPAAAAHCPRWLTFLAEITRRDNPAETAALTEYLQRVAGYSLTGVTSEAAIFFAHGTGANGKTTFVKTIADMMGDYARAVPAETFLVSRIERHPTEIANLMGARLVTATEIGRGRTWHESRLKELTGGDRVSARFMRGDFFQFTPQFKPFIAGNHKPGLRNVDEAMRRRLHLIPFTVVIPKEKRDQDLGAKLRAEAPSILRWAIEGCLEWQRIGLNPPDEVCAATDRYLEEQDVITRWLDECVELDGTVFTTSKELFASWKSWCESANEWPGTQNSLTETLQDKGFRAGRLAVGRGLFGLRIK